MAERRGKTQKYMEGPVLKFLNIKIDLYYPCLKRKEKQQQQHRIKQRKSYVSVRRIFRGVRFAILQFIINTEAGHFIKFDLKIFLVMEM
jgi:hypothetical protein